MKFDLRDVKLETKYSYVIIAIMALIIFLGSYISWRFPTIEGFLIGAAISVIGSIISLFAVQTKLAKHIRGEIAESIGISDQLHIVLMDKDGKVIKETKIP